MMIDQRGLIFGPASKIGISLRPHPQNTENQLVAMEKPGREITPCLEVQLSIESKHLVIPIGFAPRALHVRRESRGVSVGSVRSWIAPSK